MRKETKLGVVEAIAKELMMVKHNKNLSYLLVFLNVD